MSEPANAPQSAWSLPHIESDEASGDPFITDIPVSQFANDDGPTSEGPSDIISAHSSLEETVASEVDVTLHSNGDNETGLDEPALNVEIAHVDRPAPVIESFEPAPHASDARPQKGPRTDVESLLDGHRWVADQILANIETNERAALQAAGALLQARSLPEIMTVQLRFGVEQFAALGIQSAELVGLMGKIYSSSFTSIQRFTREGGKDRLGDS